MIGRFRSSVLGQENFMYSEKKFSSNSSKNYVDRGISEDTYYGAITPSETNDEVAQQRTSSEDHEMIVGVEIDEFFPG